MTSMEYTEESLRRLFSRVLDTDDLDLIGARINQDYDSKEVYDKFGIDPVAWKHHVHQYARGGDAPDYYDNGVLDFCHEIYGPPESLPENETLPENYEEPDISRIIYKPPESITNKERNTLEEYVDSRRVVPEAVSEFMLRLLKQHVNSGIVAAFGTEFDDPLFEVHHILPENEDAAQALQILKPGKVAVEPVADYPGAHYDAVIGLTDIETNRLSDYIRPGGVLVLLKSPDNWHAKPDKLKLQAAYRLPDSLMGMVVGVYRKEPGEILDYENYFHRHPANVLGKAVPETTGSGIMVIGDESNLLSVNTGSAPKPPFLPERWEHGAVRDGLHLPDLYAVQNIEDPLETLFRDLVRELRARA